MRIGWPDPGNPARVPPVHRRLGQFYPGVLQPGVDQWKRGLRLVILGVALVALGGCAVLADAGFYVDLFRANRAGVRFRRTHESLALDVPYTSISDVRLDIYSPQAPGTYPVIIFVHGGGWDSYNKDLFAPVAMQLVPRDMVVAIPNYTLHPDATYRQMTREIAAAVAWTFENAPDHRGDPERIFLSGHSAGGHLSGLVAFDPRWLAEHGRTPGELAGWIGLAGVYDVDRQMAFERRTGGTAPVMTAVMEGEPNFPDASPQTHALATPDRNPPRTWLIHGAADETVPVQMSEAFARALGDAGIPAELVIYPDTGHSDFLFDALSDDDAPVLRDLGRIVELE